MKTPFLFLLGLMALAGCSADDTTSAEALQTTEARPANPKNNTVANQVLMLQVDFETHVFEGGKKLFYQSAETFAIASDYDPPGDFGGVTLRYAETNEMLFAGTIIWMGTGQMTFPAGLNPAGSFATIASPVPMPTSIETVQYTQFAYYPEPMPYQAIWNAVDHLQVVAQFRASNPNGTVHVFLYTPSVGVGNPAEWDYFVMLKN
ncbi:hypothetical protein [Flavobacterium caeni]|uniref:HmuY protein n=1 Tax=Flavobacterium caeni TaxID=490189 RepID=A0A1G5GI90_9FLAO|nr:hypothetical protein [Flavobacterium caeni]SCY50428.1 hypothetical protein SAMN02927903_01563 [Flavobacterium caeni]